VGEVGAGEVPKRPSVPREISHILGWRGLVLAVALAAAVPAFGGEPAEELDRYGGWRQTRSAATGWFRTWRSGGRWWLVDPSGRPFLSIGVNGVSLRDGAARGAERSAYGEAALGKYGSESAWAAAAVARLRGWGFNTLGGGCEAATRRQAMPYAVTLNLLDLLERREEQTFPDVFDPAYETAVRRYVMRVCRPVAEDPYLIGYFAGEDPGWGADRKSRKTLFAQFVALDDRAPGRRRLLWFLENRYLNIAEMNEVWGTTYQSFEQVGRVPQVGSKIPDHDVDDFMRAVAREYFRIAHDAIRTVDEHHLLLGCRFAGDAPEPVLEAMADYVDAVSLKASGERPPAAHLRKTHRITGRPVLIAEFTVCLGGAAATQQERGERYEAYVEELLALPMVVGFHWVEHADRAPETLARGEVNCGLVNAEDGPYSAFAVAVQRANRAAYGLAGIDRYTESEEGEGEAAGAAVPANKRAGRREY